MHIQWQTVIAVVIGMIIFQLLNKVVLEKLTDKLAGHLEEGLEL